MAQLAMRCRSRAGTSNTGMQWMAAMVVARPHPGPAPLFGADDLGEPVGVDGLDVVGVEAELELVPPMLRRGRPVVLLLQGQLQEIFVGILV